MPLRKITLHKLYQLAGKDRRLFNAVLKNPRKALEARGMTLSPGDLRSLKRSLQKVYKISGKRLAKIWVECAGWPTPPSLTNIIPWP